MLNLCVQLFIPTLNRYIQTTVATESGAPNNADSVDKQDARAARAYSQVAYECAVHQHHTQQRLAMLSLISACLTAAPSGCAYDFRVCSGAGGAHGVDFRSHFSVYGAQHGLAGWVRNACDDCVYGQFSGACETAQQLAAIIASPARITAELASKARNLTTDVNKTASFPSASCPGLPSIYMAAPVQVDWSYALNCSSPCACVPTDHHDCQQTMPLPAAAHFTKDCQRSPLGNSTANFADCNSVHVDAATGTACFVIAKVRRPPP